MTKVSIITINYNNKNGLMKTMESVVEQSIGNFQYIVIDGDSQDGSEIEIKRYGDKISYWVSEKDMGIYEAMNKGIKQATGEYCMFLNSGDWLVDEFVIEKMLKALPEGCSVFYGNMLKRLPDGTIYRDTCEAGKISMMTLYKGALNHSPALIKRSLFDKYGLYDESLKVVSDWKWYLNVIGLNNESVKYIDMDITSFDMTGISNTNTTLEKQERRKVLQELLPANILKDYDNHWFDIIQMKRLKKYPLTRWITWFMERCLFKYEKIRRR